MTNEFKDITDRLGNPKWFDSLGYPRYCEFHPDKVSNIYAEYVTLIEIGCQNCSRTWIVAVNTRKELFLNFPVKHDIGSFLYGDPPSHVKHDHAGSTMNCVPIRVLQFWKKVFRKKGPRRLQWIRVKKHEGIIKQDWAKDLVHIQRRQANIIKAERKKMRSSKKKWQVYPRAKR